MKTPPSLADFIDGARSAIVAEWQAFAKTLTATGGDTTPVTLRDHADEILTAIIHDMRSSQTSDEQTLKSKGQGQARRLGEMGKIHATLRIDIGFKLPQMVAEYRALRGSVMRLWERKGSDPTGVTRFNEAIDEALTEAVCQFTETTEHYRDQSVGILSHDLRNPLSGIMTGASLLMSTETLDDRSARVATRMLTSAQRMSRMIDDLLDLTRTRFGDPIPVVPAAIDLEPLCRQVIAELEGLRPNGALRFTAYGDLRGHWDADRIAQALSNLVRNAIQHGSASEPIDLIAKDEGGDVTLEVHNGGAAIPPLALGTLFAPMIRHVSDERANVGLGLGLYIASQIVLAHGGKLDVTSTDAAGTTFTARVPRLVAHKRAPAARGAKA